VSECRSFIREEFGKAYLPSRARTYKSAKRAQEAHEAIRPTSVNRTPEALKPFLSRDQHRLYDLIWRQFVACQMEPAVFAHTRIDVEAGRGLFRARGKVLRFDGYLRAVGGAKVEARGKKKAEPLLPDVSAGNRLELRELTATQHFTQPPPRFTEATLVKALEKEGIGRPSTYAQIIRTIQERKYVKQEQRAFHATPLGMLVTDKLIKHFPDILDTRFTSKMEDELDKVEEAKMAWQEAVQDFYTVFEMDLLRAKEEMRGVNEDPEPSEYICENCGKGMVYLWNKWGRFLGCSGYPDCQTSHSVDDEGLIRRDEASEHVCDQCHKPMVIKSGKRGKFLACTGFPNCKRTMSLDATGAPVKEERVEIDCETCGAPMVVKNGRRGQFLGCSAYPKCRTTRPWPPTPEGEAPAGEAPTVEESCPDCGKAMTLKRGRRGPFLACTGYPACKKTKPAPAGMRPKPKPAGIDCDKCKKPMVIRQGYRGEFVACTGYPKCRNTKSMKDLAVLQGQT
jgi:DNA topoisomerase-1